MTSNQVEALYQCSKCAKVVRVMVNRLAWAPVIREFEAWRLYRGSLPPADVKFLKALRISAG